MNKGRENCIFWRPKKYLLRGQNDVLCDENWELCDFLIAKYTVIFCIFKVFDHEQDLVK